jgi:hypothetical protein
MKINVAFIPFSFALVLLLGCYETKGQEAGSPSFEAYDKDPRNEREKAIAHPEIMEDQKITKDSVSFRPRSVYKPSPVAPKGNDPAGSENDHSILSFNFLYYLIQKYKMQDILE